MAFWCRKPPDDKDTLAHKLEVRSRAPYYWPEFQSLMQLFLAVSIVGMVFFILQQLFSGDTVKIDASARDIVMIIIGIILGNFKDVYNFTFGASASDKSKSEAINKSMEVKDKTIQANATAASAAASAEPNKPIVVVSWWSLFDDPEKGAVEDAALKDENIKVVLEKFKTGTAEAPDLATLVAKGLLTSDRAAVIQTANREVKTP